MKVIILKYGELVLKGLNRPSFERQLLSNIKNKLKKFGKFKINNSQSLIYIKFEHNIDEERIMLSLGKVFGIASICVAQEAGKDINEIFKLIVSNLNNKLQGLEKSFKVKAMRQDKKFHLTSPQINAVLGEMLLDKFPCLNVDVRSPDILINVDIRDKAYIYYEKYSGAGGMPIGTNGKAMLLLSGGIDSPVAGYMIGKRGVELEAVHFYSFPYTGTKSKEKVLDLGCILSDFCGKIKLHIVPFADIQVKINKICPKRFLTLIMRRIMMDIAQRISVAGGAKALITGESIGQVASQTMDSLVVTDEMVSIPVFRPLIGMDKEEIVCISKKIGTYQTSILPHQDCCTVFLSKHPSTKPIVTDVINAQKLLDAEGIEGLILEAIENREIYDGC